MAIFLFLSTNLLIPYYVNFVVFKFFLSPPNYFEIIRLLTTIDYIFNSLNLRMRLRKCIGTIVSRVVI